MKQRAPKSSLPQYMEVSGQIHAAVVFPEITPSINLIEGQVAPRAGLDAMVKRNISDCAGNRIPAVHPVPSQFSSHNRKSVLKREVHK